MFRDRSEAGRLLAEELSPAFAGASDTVVLGIPRGGVIVAEEIARRLDLPLDVVIASKIGAPGNPEFAVGAVDPDGAVTPNPQVHYSASELEHLARPAREKIMRRLALYRGGVEGEPLEGRTVLLVDDGIATGLTVKAAIGYLRGQGVGRIVLAVPVIAASSARELRDLVDDLVAVEEPESFYAVGQFYRHFDQTSDDEVLAALAGRGSSAGS